MKNATLLPNILLFLIILAVHPSSSAESKPRKTTRERVALLNTDVDSLARQIILESPADKISGIWSATTDGARIAILPYEPWACHTGITIPDNRLTKAQRWVIVLLDNPTPNLPPGTIMGWMSPAAKPEYYTSTIYTKVRRGRMQKPKEFILNRIDDGHLTMQAVNKGLHFDPLRLLPYLFRRISLKGAFHFKDDTPRDINGFLRQWPVPRNPQNPRSL